MTEPRAVTEPGAVALGQAPHHCLIPQLLLKTGEDVDRMEEDSKFFKRLFIIHVQIF